MDDEDFWMLIYAAAISNNHSNKVAEGIADDAVKHRQDRWRQGAEVPS